MTPNLQLLESPLSLEDQLASLNEEMIWIVNLVQSLRLKLELLEAKTRRVLNAKTQSSE